MLEGQDLKLGMINVFKTKSVELEKLPVQGSLIRPTVEAVTS